MSRNFSPLRRCKYLCNIWCLRFVRCSSGCLGRTRTIRHVVELWCLTRAACTSPSFLSFVGELSRIALSHGMKYAAELFPEKKVNRERKRRRHLSSVKYHLLYMFRSFMSQLGWLTVRKTSFYATQIYGFGHSPRASTAIPGRRTRSKGKQRRKKIEKAFPFFLTEDNTMNLLLIKEMSSEGLFRSGKGCCSGTWYPSSLLNIQ